MPSDGTFAFNVLLGGYPVPEYAHDGEVYVESNLYTPLSFEQEISELVNGEKEIQNFPVTPYQLLIRLSAQTEASAFFVYVDGVMVTKVLLETGESRVVKGFPDRGGTKEFLFALPRFARSKADKIEESRKTKIGKIEVVRKSGKFVKEEYRPIVDTKFNQASKKDAHMVTEGGYTMSTTKKGRYIKRQRPYEVKLKKMWKIDREVGRLSVNYRMGHTLEEMGLQLKTIDWSQAVTRRSTRSGRSSTDTIDSRDSTSDENHQYHLMMPTVDHIKEQPPEED